MTISAQRPTPHKRTASPARLAAADFVIIDIQDHILALHRMQRLADRFGVPGPRARMVADLIWGGVHG